MDIPQIYISPAFPLCDIGPCADIRQSFRQCVDIPVRAINALYLAGKPVRWHGAALVEMGEYPLEEAGMFGRRDAPEIGDPADIPEEPDRVT